MAIAPAHMNDPRFAEEILMTALWLAWPRPRLVHGSLIGAVDRFVRIGPTREAGWVLWRWMNPSLHPIIPQSKPLFSLRVLGYLARSDPRDGDHQHDQLFGDLIATSGSKRSSPSPICSRRRPDSARCPAAPGKRFTT